MHIHCIHYSIVVLEGSDMMLTTMLTTIKTTIVVTGNNFRLL